jgi:hypothetical protein
MKRHTLYLAITSSLVLSACGGGGGGSGGSTSPTPVQTSNLTPITASNAGKAAASGYTANNLINGSSSSVTGVLTGVTISGTGIGAVSPVVKLVKRTFGQANVPLLTGATVSQACPGGGTITVDGTLRNPQMVSNGDTMTVTAQNCVEDGNNLNGRMSITFSDVSGDIMNTWVGAATMNTSLTNFSIAGGGETATLNGDMKIAITSTSATSSSITISGKSLQASEQKGGAAVATFTLADFSLTGSTNGTTTTSASNFSLSGNVNGLGQFAYTVKSLQPFVSVGTAMPGSGALIVNGAASSVTATALGNSGVRLDYSAKGDGVITQTTTLSWADFVASL